MIVRRIWRGKKEFAEVPYFCGQVWNAERQLWQTVTPEFDSESLAASALQEVIADWKESTQ